MRSTLTVVLLAASMLCVMQGCKIADNAGSALQWIVDKEAVIDGKLEDLAGKVEGLKADAATERARLEAIYGPMDMDGDGRVTVREVRAYGLDIAKQAIMSADARSDLLSGDLWLALGGALAGLTAGAAAGNARGKKVGAQPAQSAPATTSTP